MTQSATSTERSACCSTFYEQDWVRALADNVFHPGGAALTLRTADAMGLHQGAKLLDIGCGTGNTASLLAAERGLQVVGLDVSSTNLVRASREATQAWTRFVRADAQRLPFGDRSFDGVILECVLSLLADKTAAVREIRRILKPGGRVGLSDVVLDGAIPADFADAAADWACLNSALGLADYVNLFESEGFVVGATRDESAGIRELVGHIKRKLVLVGAGGVVLGRMPIDVGTVRYWLDRFLREVDAGTITYLSLQIELPDRETWLR